MRIGIEEIKRWFLFYFSVDSINSTGNSYIYWLIQVTLDIYIKEGRRTQIYPSISISISIDGFFQRFNSIGKGLHSDDLPAVWVRRNVHNLSLLTQTRHESLRPRRLPKPLRHHFHHSFCLLLRKVSTYLVIYRSIQL